MSANQICSIQSAAILLAEHSISSDPAVWWNTSFERVFSSYIKLWIIFGIHLNIFSFFATEKSH